MANPIQSCYYRFQDSDGDYWIADCEDDDEAKLLVGDEDSIFESFEVIAVDPVHYFRAFWKSTDIDDQDDEIYEEEFNTLDDIAFWQRYENADGHSPCIRIEEWKNGVLQKIILE